MHKIDSIPSTGKVNQGRLQMHEFDSNQPENFKARIRASFDKTPPSYGTNGDFHWELPDILLSWPQSKSGKQF